MTLSGEVGDTIEATLIPPEEGELRGCGCWLAAIGDGVLSTAEDTSVLGVVTVPVADCVLLSACLLDTSESQLIRSTLTLACMLN